MMGGDRDKSTLWWCSDNTFQSFNLMCTGDHTHKSWEPTISATGLHYPTAEEAAYPMLLCERVAHLMNTSAALHHVHIGFPPRGHKLKPLVSEFSEYRTWIFPCHQ